MIPLIVDHLPILNQNEIINTPLVAETGQDFMVKVLREASATSNADGNWAINDGCSSIRESTRH